MSNEEFLKLADSILTEVQTKLVNKQAEYNHDKKDRLESFRRSARRHNMTPLQVAQSYQNKHTDVLETLIEGNLAASEEKIIEVITDHMAYDIIIFALMREGKK